MIMEQVGKIKKEAKVAYTELLDECSRIGKERGEKYGEVKSNFEDTSNIIDSMFGVKVSPENIVKVMIALKLSRNKFAKQKDNLVDLINYIAILEYLESNK